MFAEDYRHISWLSEPFFTFVARVVTTSIAHVPIMRTKAYAHVKPCDSLNELLSVPTSQRKWSTKRRVVELPRTQHLPLTEYSRKSEFYGIGATPEFSAICGSS